MLFAVGRCFSSLQFHPCNAAFAARSTHNGDEAQSEESHSATKPAAIFSYYMPLGCWH